MADWEEDWGAGFVTLLVDVFVMLIVIALEVTVWFIELAIMFVMLLIGMVLAAAFGEIGKDN